MENDGSNWNLNERSVTEWIDRFTAMPSNKAPSSRHHQLQARLANE